MHRKFYHVAWEEKYPALVVDLFAQAVIKYPHVIGNNISEYHSFIEPGKRVIAFYSDQAQKKINLQHGRYFLRKNKSRKLFKKYSSLINDHIKLVNMVNKYDYYTSNDFDLKNIWFGIYNHLLEVSAYFRSTRPEAEVGPTKVLKNILASQPKSLKIEQYSRLLTTSRITTIIEKERADWANNLNFTSRNLTIRRLKLVNHIKMYPSYFPNSFGPEEALKILQIRFVNDKKKLPTILREVNNSKFLRKSIIRKQKAMLYRIKNLRLNSICDLLQKFGWYRLELKNVWAGAAIEFYPFWRAICQRHNITLKDFFSFYALNDITNLLIYHIRLPVKETKKRKLCFALQIKDGRYKISSGKNALTSFRRILSALKYSDEISGVVAYPGKVRGRVRIILPGDELNDKTRSFRRKDILVTTNTQPSMVPIMRLAGAIVNDIGGLTSHASIISREFRIPCIVGTKVATKVLKDGDLVEVDAERGIVRKLP